LQVARDRNEIFGIQPDNLFASAALFGNEAAFFEYQQMLGDCRKAHIVLLGDLTNG